MIFFTNSARKKFFIIKDGKIVSKTFDILSGDYIENHPSEGCKRLTLKDRWQNGHNGDWEDETFVVSETFEAARALMVLRAESKLNLELERINSLKEPN